MPDRGWLTPEGKWHECAYDEHDALAEKISGKTLIEVEKLGWCRVHGQDRFVPFVCERRLTAAQRNELSRRGFLVEEND